MILGTLLDIGVGNRKKEDIELILIQTQTWQQVHLLTRKDYIFRKYSINRDRQEGQDYVFYS